MKISNGQDNNGGLDSESRGGRTRERKENWDTYPVTPITRVVTIGLRVKLVHQGQGRHEIILG
jgi:hypothetical protein